MKKAAIFLLALLLPSFALAQVMPNPGVPLAGQGACYPYPYGNMIAPCVVAVRGAPRVVTAAGAVTVSASTDYVVEVNKTTGAATTVNLPAGVAGQQFVVKDGKGDAAANNITVTPAAGLIDGSATYVISSNYGSVTIVYDGTKWITF